MKNFKNFITKGTKTCDADSSLDPEPQLGVLIFKPATNLSGKFLSFLDLD